MQPPIDVYRTLNRPGPFRTFFLLLAGCTVITGCALSPFTLPSGGDSAAVRAERRIQAIKQFETHRDSAQYAAAMDRWKAGDPFTCEAELRSILGRNPNFPDARRALADLALERGDIATAERELRALIEANPQDDQTHHSLGLLLESTDRSEEARIHLAKAIELAPDNPLYRLSLPDAG